MNQFELFVDDDRYRVPTLTFVMVTDTHRALEIAEGLMGESPHHHGVEVCQRGRRLFGIGSCATKPEAHPSL